MIIFYTSKIMSCIQFPTHRQQQEKGGDEDIPQHHCYLVKLFSEKIFFEF